MYFHEKAQCTIMEHSCVRGGTILNSPGVMNNIMYIHRTSCGDGRWVYSTLAPYVDVPHMYICLMKIYSGVINEPECCVKGYISSNIASLYCNSSSGSLEFYNSHSLGEDPWP